MKNKLLILLFVIISLQSWGQDADPVDQVLEGQWEWLGFYKNDQPKYDTLSTVIEDSFDPEISSKTNIIIWTDSGTYVHRYEKENLKGIELSSNLSISEFIFQSNRSGKVLDYEIDPNQNNEEHPRVTALELGFKIESNAIILTHFDSITTAVIDKLTDNELTLRFEDGSASRFKKI